MIVQARLTVMCRAASMLLIVLAVLAALANGRYLLAHNATESLRGSWFIVDRAARAGPHRRGALVAFVRDGTRWGYPPHTLWAKRIAGLPGDPIRTDGVRVWVNGRLAGAVDPQAPLDIVGAAAVPAGHVFVIGDSPASLDSRYAQFGFVPLAALHGSVMRIG